MSISNTALSGIDAANNQLSVISNNIANSNTTGFKSSSVSFADVYALNGSVGSQIGTGVSVGGIVQDFGTGGVNLTGKTLDMSIANNDFFVLQNPAGNQVYSRAGAFTADKNGNIVDNTGSQLQGYLYSGTGAAQTLNTVLAPLTISTTASAPVATTTAATQINLDSRSAILPQAGFLPTNPATYSARSDLTVYDSLGNSHTVSSFYVKTATNTWDMSVYLDQGTAAQIGPIAGDTAPANNFFTMSFNNTGALTSVGLPVAGNTASLSFGALGNGAANLTIAQDFTGSTQYGSTTTVNSNTQNGNTSGTITGVNVDSSGVISASFSNGTTNNLGKVALAKFTNPQGLLNLSNNEWAQTNASGAPLIQAVNSNNAIQSGSLENSNVDLPKNLVDLISAQRYFQANTQSIQVANTVLDAIINIR